MSHNLTAILVGLVCALAMVPSPPGFCQESSAPQSSPPAREAGEPAGQQTTPPAPTPLSEIARRTEEAEEELIRIREVLSPAPEVETIAQELATLDEPLAEGRRAVEDEQLSQLSRRDLGDLRQEWEELGQRAEGWESQVESRAQALVEARDRLAAMKSEWDRTRESVGEQEIPAELLAQVQRVVAEAEEATALVDEQLRAVLSLQARLAEQGANLDLLLARIAEETTRRRESFLERDEPPVWEVILRPESATLGLAEAAQAWEKNVAALGEFIERYGARLVLHLVVFFALWALFRALGRRSESWTITHHALQAADYLFRHPLASALLLSLAATRPIYPNAPLAVYDLAGLLVLVPLTRLLPGMVDRKLRGAAVGMILVLALDEIRSLFFPVGLIRRLLLLAILAGALLILVSGLRVQRRSGRMEGSYWRRAGFWASWLAAAILAVALLATLTGRVTVADFLASATLTSFRYGLVLFVGALVVDGLIMVLLRSRPARSLRSVRLHTELLQRRVIALVHALAVYLWVVATLTEFQLLEPFRRWLGGLLSWHWTRGNLSISLGDVLVFALVIFGAMMLSRFVRFLLQEDVYPRARLARGVPATISVLVNYLILGIGFFFALAAAGIDLSRVALLAGALGVGIGFGLQDLVNNFVSGLILVFERPVGVGDLVEVAGLQGRVQQIGIRASTVRTFDGAEVIIPNGQLLSGQLVNWTLSDRLRRLTIPVGVAYGTDSESVIELLLRVAHDHPEVQDDPEPVALFRGFGDSALQFELRAWIADFNEGFRLSSELTVAVDKALAAAGIEIPFPQRDLHLRSVDPKALAAKTHADSAPIDDS